MVASLSLFSPPLCSSCGAESCAGVSGAALCPSVLAVASFVASASGVPCPVARAALGLSALRAGALSVPCPCCGRRICSGPLGVRFLASCAARPRPARALACPVCARLVSPSRAPSLAARVRRFVS